MTTPTKEETLKRYKRFMQGATPEHDRVLKEAASFYQAYGGNSIQGSDFSDLSELWGSNPPEVAILLANVDAFWGSLIGSRREPTFPGFDQGLQDEVVGEFMTMLVKAGRRWAKSDTVDEAALMDLIICGMAWSELNLDTDTRPPFRPKEKWIPLDRVWWDPGHMEQNAADAQEIAVRSYFGVDEASARFPDFADRFKAMREGGGSGSKEGAPRAGAQALGGPAVSVSVTAADGGEVRTGSDGSKRRLREVPIDDFQFLHFEQLLIWELPGKDGKPMKFENTREVYDEMVKVIAEKAMAGGQPFRPPETLPFCAATWYRCRVLAQSIAGDPLVLTDPEPIPGNQRLARCMTGKGELVRSGEDRLKRRWFGWGRLLLGLQRLVSVAIRIEIEQEARRNRGSADVEADAFPSPAEFASYVESRRIPGAVQRIPVGAWDKIHERPESVGTRVTPMKEIFEFFSKDLPEYILGMSDMNRGTFQGDRSVKLVDTMLQSSAQMQTQFTSAYTHYLDEGAVTMGRLLLGPKGLDGADIDKLLGATGAKLREGITGQVNQETGQLEPIMVPDPEGEPPIDPATGQPQVDPETGQPMPAMKPVTVGSWMIENVGEIFDHDIGFGLRPAAASERAANSALMSQHGVLDVMLQNVPDKAKRYVLKAYLNSSFAEGTPLADLQADLDKVYQEQEQQETEQAKVQQEDGWLAFISDLATKEPDKAFQMMQQASEAVMQPGAQGGQQQGQQPPQGQGG